MNPLPTPLCIVRVAINDQPSTHGAFIDPEFVFHAIDEGRWEFTVERERLVVSPGDLLLLPPRRLHLVRPLDEPIGRHLVVHFLPVPPLPELERAPRLSRPPEQEFTRVRHVFAALRDEWRRRWPHWESAAAGSLLRLLSIHLRWTREEPSAARPPVDAAHWPPLARAIQFIEKRGLEPGLSLKAIADAAELSVSQLCRVFHRETGLTPRRYLEDFRLRNAQQMLLTTPLTCTEIADRCGFGSVHRFTKVFRRIYGEPPLRWQRITREAPPAPPLPAATPTATARAAEGKPTPLRTRRAAKSPRANP